MIFAGIDCDTCGKEISYEYDCKKYIIKWARQEGWKIGKLCTCPACAEKKQSVKNSAETSGRGGK
jgi:uncharacterized protein YjcR